MSQIFKAREVLGRFYLLWWQNDVLKPIPQDWDQRDVRRRHRI